MTTPRADAKASKDDRRRKLAVEDDLPYRHLLFGWWSLLLFLSLGIVLESLHGFKVQWYLGVDVETRRLMWTLAHAHGTLLALVNIAFALTVERRPSAMVKTRSWASLCLLGAGILMPTGFFLGGAFHYSGDPGLGILLVPPGGALLLISVLLVSMTLTRDAPAD